MSFSNPKRTNPAKKFIEWSGEKGQFFYYDKEKEQKIFMELPVYFIVLDELSVVTGYHQKSSSGIYSNEIRDVKNEVLHARTFRPGAYEKGTWSEIKDAITMQGGKFAKSVYALLISEKGNELVNFKFSGSSFSGTDSNKSNKAGWINAKFNKEQYGVQIKRSEHGINGKTEFESPVFEPVNISEKHSLIDAAKKADLILQDYLEYYFRQPVKVLEEKQDEKDNAGNFEAKNYEMPPSEDLGDIQEIPDKLPF